MAKKKIGLFTGFVDFIKNQGVIGLAAGLVLGTAAGSVVNSLINNVIMPPLGFLLNSADGIRGLVLKLGHTSDGSAVILHYGAFINDLVNFLVIALVIYWIVRLLKIEKDVKISGLAVKK
jgi:large conductance mechanosensitive channel